jgi:gliding motility-associated-like protein
MKVITTSIISILITILTFTGNAQNTEIAYSQNLDIYRIVAVENQNEQIVSISNTVTVEKPLTLYAPNAFSPDGDGINDLFSVRGQGANEYALEIYNRWGQMVFKSEDLDIAWNGEYHGKQVPIGTYVYQVKALNVSGDHSIVKNGSVVLVR